MSEKESVVLEARLDGQKKNKVTINSTIESSSIHRKRSLNASTIKPVLQERNEANANHSSLNIKYNQNAKDETSLEPAGGLKSKPSPLEPIYNKNLVPLSNTRRQVFSTHKNQDLVSLNAREINRALERGTGVPKPAPKTYDT